MLYLFFILLLVIVVFAIVWLVTRGKESGDRMPPPENPPPENPPPGG